LGTSGLNKHQYKIYTFISVSLESKIISFYLLCSEVKHDYDV